MITGAELLVKALKEEQVTTLFAYPGGQVIDLFDALYGEEAIDVVMPRHEQGLIHAADGYARSTGKTGVCLVTSGPGATNLVTGIATANYDSVPLVCFTGQVPTSLIGNDAFQEVDIVGITRNICKYAVTVRRREDLAQTIRKAFYIASTGKPGVVLVDLPKDIQRALGDEEYPKHVEIRGYKPNTSVHTGQMKKAISKIHQAKKPLFLVGGGVNVGRAQDSMTQLARRMGIPVVTTIMGKGAIPTEDELYVGNLGIHGSFAANSAISNCDVMIAIGTRFNDRITGKIDTFAKDAVIIHVDIDPASISRNIEVDIPIVGDVKNAVAAFFDHAGEFENEIWKDQIAPWKEQIQDWEKKYPLVQHKEGLHPQNIITAVNQVYTDAVITTDVGQNQLWTTQFIELNEQKQLLTSGGLGTMGYGLPAALGAQLGNPDRQIVAISGDGGIQMNIQELATAVAYQLPVTVCILNNGYLGNVRQWQEMFFHHRYSGTCLRYRKGCPHACSHPDSSCPAYTPDFVRLAESYGAKGIRVTEESQIIPALEEAKAERTRPTIIEFIIDREEDVMPIVPPGNALEDMIMDQPEHLEQIAQQEQYEGQKRGDHNE